MPLQVTLVVTMTEAYTVGSRIKEIEAPAARERHDAQAKKNLGIADAGNFPATVKGKTRDKVGEV